MNENTNTPTWELTYSDDYDELSGNLLKVNGDFLSVLQQHEAIVIEGREDEDFLFSVDNKTYKLRDIFLPSTMLVTRALAQSGKPRDVAYVSLETAHYLKLEAHNIEYHTIYAELMGETVGRELLEESQSIAQLVVAAGISVNSICSRFRITPAQLEQLLKHMSAMVVHRRDLPSLEEPVVVVWGNDALLSIMRELLPFLMELGATGEWFTYDQVAPLGLVKDQKILQLLAKVFDLEVEGSSSLIYSLSEPMEMESMVLRFRVKVESIVRFVILEHALAKDEYTLKEMDDSLWSLITTYLPLGLAAFEESKAKQALQELLGLYFLTIPRIGVIVRIVYDPLLSNSTIKDRLEYLRNFKKRFSTPELRGVFGRMTCECDLSGVLMKHFRKCGQEYELKLVIPK